jgi:hypothetical protein
MKTDTKSAQEAKEMEKEDVIQMIPVDEDKVNSLSKKYEEYRKSLEDKEYATSLTEDQLERFEKYTSEEVIWKGKEALGVVEIMKKIKSAKKEGRKNGVYYFNNLVVEASHYFLNKWEGKGEKDAKEFVAIIKSFEETLSLIREDNKKAEEMKKELAAAQQGLELE